MVLPIDYKFINSSPPVAIIDAASAAVTEIDRNGYDYAIIFVSLGATDIAMTALVVTESDTAGSGHANVTGLVYGTSTDIDGVTSVLPTALQDNGVFAFEIDLRGRKRYLDVTATCGDGAAGTFITVQTILLRGEVMNITTATKGLTGCLRA